MTEKPKPEMEKINDMSLEELRERLRIRNAQLSMIVTSLSGLELCFFDTMKQISTIVTDEPKVVEEWNKAQKIQEIFHSKDKELTYLLLDDSYALPPREKEERPKGFT